MHEKTVPAELFIDYENSLYFGADPCVEGLDWEIQYLTLDDSWQEFATGTTGVDGFIAIDIYPDLTYRMIATDGWDLEIGENRQFTSDTIFPYEIEVSLKSITATFLYDLPNTDMGQPPADGVLISLFYFDGVDYSYIEEDIVTDEYGVMSLGDLIVGEYYFTCEGVSEPSFLGEILEATSNLDVGVVLLPPICILVYRKIEGKEGFSHLVKFIFAQFKRGYYLKACYYMLNYFIPSFSQHCIRVIDNFWIIR